jgi:hypothetical protein
MFLSGKIKDLEHTCRTMNTHVCDNITFLFREFIYKIRHIADILVIEELACSRFIPTFKQVIKMLSYISTKIV